MSKDLTQGKINLLSEETIGKIAAGEVVERPASVVKELMENSIDAGADSIEVEIDRAGQNLIRVADNASGMDAEDVVMAFKRHATSKISRIEDLEKITTLGFRGEALASIAAVSQIDITTRKETSEAGCYMYVESGEIQKSRPAARDRGTTIEVRNLFYNVPARRKFLKKESTEMSEIAEVFSRMILSHPDVGFRLVQGGRCILDASLGMDLRGRIGLVLGEDAPSGMTPVAFSQGDISIEGFVSIPSFTRKDKRWQIFFVNGRYIRSKTLSEALYIAYKSLLERGRYPGCVLFITIPPEKIDVNVHPAKLEIKFDDESAVKASIEATVENCFKKAKRTSEITVEDDLSILKEVPDLQKEFNYGVPPGVYERGGKTDVLPCSLGADGNRLSFSRMFQLGNSYIVRVKGESLIITDQHAAHERVLYEFFSKTFSGKSVESQGLLFPVKIDLSATEAIVMENIIAGLSKLGFDIESFGARSFITRSIPSLLKPQQTENVIRDLISDLSVSAPVKTEYMEELVKLVSCRAAIKAGEVLDITEMEELFLQLDKCELPFTCPHGRPVTIEISSTELEKRFHRI